MRLRLGSGIFVRVGDFSSLFVIPALEVSGGVEESGGETSLAIGLGDFLKQGYLPWLSPSLGRCICQLLEISIFLNCLGSCGKGIFSVPQRIRHIAPVADWCNATLINKIIKSKILPLGGKVVSFTIRVKIVGLELNRSSRFSRISGLLR